MHDIQEAEARAILAVPSVCNDPPDWVDLQVPQGSSRILCGLVDVEGKRTGLHVSMLYRKSQRTGIEKFVFSVMRQTISGVDRVYQLDVEKFKVKARSDHALPHEHIGDLRRIGAVEWAVWSYAEIVAHFCNQANIAFVPNTPNDPSVFELRG